MQGIFRRRFLQLAASAAAFPTAPRVALGGAFPERPVRIIVGFAPGGPNDICARLMATGYPQFIVENRPGAGGNLATEAVVRAPADGLTLLLVGPPAAINATLYEKLNFNFVRDIGPVAGIARIPEVMVVNPSVPAKTVPEFIAYAKADPGKLSFASAGNGTIPHVAGELFKFMTGLELIRVGYRGGGPALVDLIGGQVQVMFETTLATLPYIRAGTLRVLAVASAARSPILPDIPTLAEFVPGYEATAWYGLGAPKDIPIEIVDKLNGAINAGLANADIKGRLADLGAEPMPMTPGDFGKLIADETDNGLG
jgi:tripartite-type tricarboxylate transporter receptor subunit TctC